MVYELCMNYSVLPVCTSYFLQSFLSKLGLMASQRWFSCPGAIEKKKTNIKKPVKIKIKFLPITDIIVKTAVSAAKTASSITEREQDSMEVIEKPMGWYLGLIACKASFKLAIFEKILGPTSLWDEETGTTVLTASEKSNFYVKTYVIRNTISRNFFYYSPLTLSGGGDMATIWTSPLVEVTLLLEVDSWRILGGQELVIMSSEVGDVGSLLVGMFVIVEELELESGMIISGEFGGIIRLFDKSTDLKCLSLQMPQTARPMGKIMPLHV